MEMIYTVLTIFIIGLFLVTSQKETIIKSLNKMYNCFDIADYFVRKAKEEGQGVDPMKLLKLTYIAHGWYLGFKDKPLFLNQVQAWKHGTVIPELYHVIKRYGSGYVDKSTLELYTENKIKKEDESFLNAIWNQYKQFSGGQLSDKTHEEGTPWQTSYNGLHNVTIPTERIKEYYKNLIAEKRGQ
ncbi:Panacea domain-containing protein [Flavobacterium succinicans]|nr:type II toxin-antitoxin system antitoxin SocA domain-containing protein [Flavobacterium succinicans]